MTVQEIDQYLAQLDEPKRSTLEALRQSILAIAPEAEQGLSYGVPAFRLDGRPIAGFSAAKNHVSYLPHSGSVLATLDESDLVGFSSSKGALKIPVDGRLPDRLVYKLISRRCAEIDVSL